MFPSPRVRRRTLGLVPLVLLAIAPQARAVSASASLDWSGLQVKVTDTAPDDGVAAGITWLGTGSTSAFRCPSAGECALLGETGDWRGALTASTSGPSFAGEVAWSAASLAATIEGRTIDDDIRLMMNRWRMFQFDGAGEVTFTLPFTVAVDATGSDAVSGSFAMASLWTDAGSDEWYISSPWDGTHSRSGLLSVTLAGESGATRYFAGTAYAHLDHQPVLPPPVAAPVPEPATLAMLLGGVGLVIGASRRRVAAVDKPVDALGAVRG